MLRSGATSPASYMKGLQLPISDRAAAAAIHHLLGLKLLNQSFAIVQRDGQAILVSWSTTADQALSCAVANLIIVALAPDKDVLGDLGVGWPIERTEHQADPIGIRRIEKHWRPAGRTKPRRTFSDEKYHVSFVSPLMMTEDFFTSPNRSIKQVYPPKAAPGFFKPQDDQGDLKSARKSRFYASAAYYRLKPF